MRSLRDAAWRARDFFRRDAVLAIACVLAAASCVAVPPDAGYADYIDWRTIGLLFSLMVATSGLARAGVLAGTISIACRYVHSACETISLADCEGAKKMLVAFLRQPGV